MEQKKHPFDRPMSRRQLLRLMGGAASVTALAACTVPTAPGAAPAAGGEGAAPAAAPSTLVVNHRREYFAEMETLFAEAVQNWANENNVEVETSTVAAEANQDFVPKLLAQVEAGNPPDLVYHVRLVQQLYSFNALEPVSDTVAQAIELYGDPSYGHFLNNQIEGEWYGIPYINSGGGQFARRSAFEEQGIDPLADLVTYDDIREAALAISDPASEFYGWGRTVNRGGDGHGTVVDIIHNWGGQITNEDMTELTFNSPETIAAVEWLTELFTSSDYAPALPPGIMSWTDSSNNEAFLAGNLGYTSNAASVYASAKADGNPIFEDTVVLNIPIGPYGEQFIGGGGNGQMQIPRGAKNVEGAKALAMYLLEPDVFVPISLVSAGLFLPAYARYYEMPEVIAAFEADENLARMGEQTQGTHPGLSWPAGPSPYFDAINAQSVLNDMMAQTITQGVSPADAVAQAEARMVQIAEEMGALGN
jgi:multiple sugar transport system substrate-binding protein